MMDIVEKLISELKKNWNRVYIWEDKPNEIYEKHNHPYETKLIIIDGDIKIKIDNKISKLNKGGEIIIKSNENHWAKVGKNGCKYIAAEGRK